MIFDEFQLTKQNAEHWAASLFKMGVAIKIVEQTGLETWVNRDPNMATRNLKRGFVWYLAKESVEEMTTMNSNFRHLNSPEGISVLVVDTVADAVISAAMEQTKIAQTLDSMVKGVTGNSPASSMLVTVVLTTIGTRLSESLIMKAGIDKHAFKFFLIDFLICQIMSLYYNGGNPR